MSASGFYGSGANLTGLPVQTVANAANDRIATFSSTDALNGESILTFSSANLLTVLGDITASVNVSGSEFYAEEYYGDGSKLTGVTGTISAVANGVDNRIATFSQPTLLMESLSLLLMEQD